MFGIRDQGSTDSEDSNADLPRVGATQQITLVEGDEDYSDDDIGWPDELVSCFNDEFAIPTQHMPMTFRCLDDYVDYGLQLTRAR